MLTFHIKFHEKIDFIEFEEFIKKGVNVDALITETHEKHEKWSPLFWHVIDLNMTL